MKVQVITDSDTGLQARLAQQLGIVILSHYLFHGENHNLSRNGKPHHRLRRLREIMSWFDQYLK